MADTFTPIPDRYDAVYWDGMEYAICRFSKRQVVNAGRTIVSFLPDVTEGAVEAFRIAYNWRAAHLLPMHRMRIELGRKGRRIQPAAITAAQIKRMQSIRRKLKKTNYTLYQVQDIGGCRIILNSMQEVDELLSVYRQGGSQHHLNKEYDYINKPKNDGYRSHHIVFKFQGNDYDSETYNRQFIEIQFRTKVQHAWATALEAVGLVRKENLKGGEGDADWLRFFQLVSGEFAVAENRALVPGVSENKEERLSELKDIQRKLKAMKMLQSYNQIIKYADNIKISAPFYVVKYDYDRNEVNISGINTAISGSEAQDFGLNIVLIEVDKVEDLKAAFPNYFLDVQMFTRRVEAIISGVAPSPAQDLSWVTKWRGR